MRTIAAFAAVAAVLMAIGVVAAELVREDPPKILFPRPGIDAGVRGNAFPESIEGIAIHDTAAGDSPEEV